MFGNPETTPGGKALKFYTSLRLDIRRIAQIKKGEEIVGSRTRVKVVKNKVAAPFKQTEFDIIYGEGISLEGELIALGEKLGNIVKSGTSYSFIREAKADKVGSPEGTKPKKSKTSGDSDENESDSNEVKLGRGYDATRTFMRENPKLRDEILKSIRKRMKEVVMESSGE